MTVTSILFPPTFSVLNFTLKLDVASMYETTLLALVPISLILLNSQPSLKVNCHSFTKNTCAISLSPDSLIILILRWSAS